MKNWEKNSMERRILDVINKDFQESERTTVVDYLSSIELGNVRMAILTLAKGDMGRVASLAENVKKDYRDVLMWAEMGEDRMKAEFEGNMLSLINLAEKGWLNPFDADGFIEVIQANASAVKDPEKMIERIKRIKRGELGDSKSI